jgi:hypothetical protein
MALVTDKVPEGYLREMRQLMIDISNGDATWSNANDIRKKYGLSSLTIDTIRRGALLYSEFNASGWVNEPVNKNIPTKNTTTLDSKGVRTSEKFVALSEDELTDKTALLKAHGYNPVQFELLNAKNSIWQQGDGKGGLKNLYSSRITVKPTDCGLDLEELRKYFEGFKSKPVILKEHSSEKEGYLVINLADLHIGRSGYEKETGEDFDLDQAELMVNNITEQFLRRYQGRKFKKIVLCIGNDVMNSAANGWTSSGRHQQSNCASFKEIFDKTCEIIINTIDSFKEIAPVMVVHVEGNHDRNESYMLGRLLEAYYRLDENVEVDALPSTRKYIRLGNNLIGFAHGSEEKDRIYTLMQIEQPKNWSECPTRIWLLGHLHHLMCKENAGVEVWTCPSPTAKDEWTAKTGFVSNRRTTGFVFNSDSGLEEVHFVYV